MLMHQEKTWLVKSQVCFEFWTDEYTCREFVGLSINSFLWHG